MLEPTSSKNISSDEDPQRTERPLVPYEPRSGGRAKWREEALRWAPHIGPILIGIAALVKAALPFFT